MTDESEDRLEIAEERIALEKRPVATGRLRVRTVTELEEVLVPAELEGEAVEVARVPRGEEIEAAPAVRTEGDVTIVPVVEEVLVVEKRLFLKEEIHIRRRATEERVEVPVTVRRQRAVVDRLDPDRPDE